MEFKNNAIHTVALILILSIVACDRSSDRKFNTTGIETQVNPADLDPELFLLEVDNKLFPLMPGRTYVYGGAEQVVVEVSDQKKLISGVTAFVVRDRVFEDGSSLVIGAAYFPVFDTRKLNFQKN